MYAVVLGVLFFIRICLCPKIPVCIYLSRSTLKVVFIKRQYTSVVLLIMIALTCLQPGMMIAVNNTRDLSMTVGRFYVPFNKTTSEDAVFSLPYIDSADGGNLTLSLHLSFNALLECKDKK